MGIFIFNCYDNIWLYTAAFPFTISKESKKEESNKEATSSTNNSQELKKDESQEEVTSERSKSHVSTTEKPQEAATSPTINLVTLILSLAQKESKVELAVQHYRSWW